MSKYKSLGGLDEGDTWAALLINERLFRKDRAFIWDVMQEATDEYFNHYNNCELPVTLGARHGSDAVKVVVKATGRL